MDRSLLLVAKKTEFKGGFGMIRHTVDEVPVSFAAHA